MLIKIEYDGTNFSGWQIQPSARTVQGEIEHVLKYIAGEDVHIHGTSRTDAGVHALGQCATFEWNSNMPVEKLAEVMNRDNEIGTRCPSVMIAGPANFPVRKKEKQVAAWDRNREEWAKVENLLRKIESVGMGGISSDDPDALEKLRRKLESLKKHQELMRAANKAVRLKDTAKGDAKLAELGFSPEDIKKLREPDYCGRVGYPDYELSNNNANIHRIEGRIKELEKRQTEPAPEGWKFDGGEVVMNTAENRLQVLFDEKPDADLRAELKSSGFRWAPSQGAWQRQLNNNAIYAAKLIKAIAPAS